MIFDDSLPNITVKKSTQPFTCNRSQSNRRDLIICSFHVYRVRLDPPTLHLSLRWTRERLPH